MEVRHNPHGIDERECTVELKPIGCRGNPRMGDCHWILGLVLGSFGGIQRLWSTNAYCWPHPALIQPSYLWIPLWFVREFFLFEMGWTRCRSTTSTKTLGRQNRCGWV